MWIDEYPDLVTDERIRVEAGDQTRIPTFECSSRRVEAQAEDGQPLAVLDEEWCPGQIWYVFGPGDYSLEQAR